MKEITAPDNADIKISVIIPALNEEENILTCIQAARRDYSENDVEIIVVDGGSSDSTLALLPKNVITILSPACRAAQMDAGALRASGEIFVFCHADSQLPEGWRDSVITSLNQRGVVGGTFQSHFEPTKGLLKWRNHITFPAKWWAMYGDQCQFLRRKTFEEIGGFLDIPIMEDLELSRSLAKIGKVVRINKRAITSSRRLLEKGIMRTTINNIFMVISYLFFGFPAEKIAQRYRSSREELYERSSDSVREKSI